MVHRFQSRKTRTAHRFHMDLAWRKPDVQVSATCETTKDDQRLPKVAEEPSVRQNETDSGLAVSWRGIGAGQRLLTHLFVPSWDQVPWTQKLSGSEQV